MTGSVPSPPSPPGPIPGRSIRPLAGVLAATAVSLTGTRVSAIALPWFVLVATGSAAQTGLVAFCEMTPYVLVKMFTGPLVDRVGPRVISWSADSLSAVAAALIPALHAFGLLPFWLLLALVAVIGAVRGPGDLAKEIMVPEAAERSRVPLERATGLSGVTERLASTVGPAAGGALVALLGPMAGIVVNAVSFALGSLVIALVLPRGMGGAVPPGSEPRESGEDSAPAGEPAGYWRRFGEGFTFLRGEPLLLTVIVMVGITNLLEAGFAAVLVPVWAERSGDGPAVIGLTSSAAGIAAVCGSLVAAALAHRMRRRPVFFAGFLVAGAPKFVVLACGAPLWAVLVVFAVSGFGGGFLNPILGAVSFERVPRALLGRVRALGDSLAWAGIPLGGLLAGLAVTSAGLAPVLLAGGALYFLTTNLAGLRPEWREMDRGRGRGARDSGAAQSAETAPADHLRPEADARAGEGRIA
ncbi:MFS transporter [Streptosporangium nondiastaticum]|uniref:Multidrug efflux pump Tap n=1 Tax=Streptosporangium nondiastaticum TaxID=35764 RepID=A0A9X7JM78_9ACTN|nr:MFS transporter [Streptosporangium nondiastaticum]PSJ26069.1 MFS transporter [Streptosporangium nondiastaticum]